jgi:hypothetical protein
MNVDQLIRKLRYKDRTLPVVLCLGNGKCLEIQDVIVANVEGSYGVIGCEEIIHAVIMPEENDNDLKIIAVHV